MLEGSELESQVRQQYRDSCNLSARVQLHRCFSTNRYGWQRWVFDQIELPPDARVLEVGCGRGDLWLDNSDRIPEGWRITLSDLSSGMLEVARANLTSIPARFLFTEADIQDMPWQAASFDGVIANHVLYHAPDVSRAVSEIRRVLRPGGGLYAATNGRAHMLELTELLDRLGIAGATLQTGTRAFLLENGAEALRREFDDVALRRYKDSLAVAEVGPLIEYVRSMTGKAALPDQVRDELSRVWERELMLEGVIRVSKDSGIFVAIRGS
jgi:ubiquinone/menaquinone biosynthesis C-methylase UbiE